MAGYGYTNQGYNTDDWNRRSNINGENGWYLDAEGRRRPTISYPPPNNSSESYYATNHSYGSPTRVEPIKEYIIIAQPEANRLTRPGYQTSPTNYPPINSGSTGYGEYTNFNNDESRKDYYRRNDTEPAMNHHHQSGWEKPGHKGHSHETTHTGPTNDIGKAAVEILKEAAISSLVSTSAAPQSRFTLPASMVPKRDAHGKIIDNKAIGRYGSFNLPSRSY